MCYTNTVFQFKVLGPAWDVVHEGETVTHQLTDVHARWAVAEKLPEPVTIRVEPKLWTVIAGHTCPSEWGSWGGRSGFLTFYRGLHSAEELGFHGETTWRDEDGYQPEPIERPDLIEDYATPYGDYDAGMCDLAAKLIQVTDVNPNHLLFWTGYGREWGPVLGGHEGTTSYWHGFAAAKGVDPDPWTVWYNLTKPDAFYPNLIHLNHCERPAAAVRDLTLSKVWAPRTREEQVKRYLGGDEAYRQWQKEVWDTDWPPPFWIGNALAQLTKALDRAPAAEGWDDRRYLVVDDFGVQILVSHEPALVLLEMLGELEYVGWNQIIELNEDDDESDDKEGE